MAATGIVRSSCQGSAQGPRSAPQCSLPLWDKRPELAQRGETGCVLVSPVGSIVPVVNGPYSQVLGVAQRLIFL